MIFNINFWTIDDICNKYPIGLTQMGYIYPRLMKYMNKDNQDEILYMIGLMYEQYQDKDKTIEEVIKHLK